MKTLFSQLDQESLDDLKQISVEIDPERKIVWVYQQPFPRPCFNSQLIQEVRNVQLLLLRHGGKLPYKGELVEIKYHVLDSLTPGIFSMGGDLNYFRDHIVRDDIDGLMSYARSCIDTIYGFYSGFDLPITTITCCRGSAYGGGFEVALSSNVVIVEEDIEMSFPEVSFDLYPGMGGFHLISERTNPFVAEKYMLDPSHHKAQDLFKNGIIDIVAAKGSGKQAVYDYIAKAEKRPNAYRSMREVRQMTNGITHDDLWSVCSHWVESAMRLRDEGEAVFLRHMERLVRAQNKKMEELYGKPEAAIAINQ